jgi:hypothetical protein
MAFYVYSVALRECDRESSSAPCLSPSHVACPPRLKPARTHSPMIRSSCGKMYDGRTSIRKDRSFTAPTTTQSKTTTRHGRSAEQTRSIYSRCYTCQRCANWEASQHRVAFSGDTAWTLARGDRCVDPLSCSMPGSLADPPSSCRGSVDPTCGNKLENNHSTISVGVATYEGNHHEVPGCFS